MKPTFKEGNDIAPVAKGKKKNPALETSIISPKALSGEMKAAEASKKKKGNTLNTGMCKCKPNEMWPV